MKKYDPQAIEAKWQKLWEETGVYHAADDVERPKYYYLFEFPYPSGDGLHVGHLRPYVGLDLMARHKRMQGYNVLFPMGWDAFGLPTENYAIKNKIAPQVATKENIASFKRQVMAAGISIDWSREIATTDPAYYRWTQWIFLQFVKAGLAYQAELPIWWCPFEKTGLANEEVVDGKHERCGTPVERKLIKQWVLKITAYADRLIDDLATVDYPDRIASQQVNWIGRSRGALVKFPVVDSDQAVEVFTTRIDTIFGGTFVVLAPEHPLVEQITTKEQQAAVKAYVRQAQAKTEVERQEDDKDKAGVFTGAYVTNPATGEPIPVWIADYVLVGYGTGAIMAVPAHDERDYEFACKFDLPVTPVIEPVTGTPQADEEFRSSIVALVRDPQTGKYLSINWGPQAGGSLLIGGGREEGEDVVETARREVAEETGYQNLKLLGQMGCIHHHYIAHSKGGQKRYIHAWGVFFELVGDQRAETSLEADEQGKFQVEWLSAEEAERAITDELHHRVFETFVHKKPFTGEGILSNSGPFDGLPSAEARTLITAWLTKKGSAEAKTQYHLHDWIFSRQRYWGEPIPIIHCPVHGAVPVPEDQLPVTLPEVESYEPTGTGESPLAAITDWVNVSCPTCGEPAKRETDTMPNWAGSSWYYLRYIDPCNNSALADPAKLKHWLMVDLYNGGMEHTTLHLLYSRFWHKFLYDQGLVPTLEPYAKRRSHGMILAADGRKMSKSLGNVVNPDTVTERYGADTLRVYEMFMGPFEDATAWSDERLPGANRFLYRFWELSHRLIANAAQGNGEAGTGELALAAERSVHKTLKKVGEDLEGMRFNTVVSALMECVNTLSGPSFGPLVTDPAYAAAASRIARLLILMLAPLAPHMAEELWHELGETKSVHVQPWPKYDPALIKDDVMTIVVQVGGKLRATVALPSDQAEDQVIEAARQTVGSYLEGQTVAKTISVPHKLVNFVIE